MKRLSRWLNPRNLTEKAYLNALAETLDYAARLVVGFAIQPILVVGLGTFGFGAWQVLNQFTGYLAAATGRPIQALKLTIANSQSSNDYHAKRLQVGCSVVVWFALLPCLMALGAVLSWFAPIWFAAPDDYAGAVRWTTLLLVANLIVLSAVDIPRSALMGENMTYKRMGVSALLVLLGGVLMVVAVKLDTGLIGVAAAAVAVSVLSGLLFLHVARVNIRWFGIARPSSAEARKFFKLSGWFLAWSLVMVAMRASDVVLLGLLDSIEQVTEFALTKYVPQTIINLVAIVVFGITPGLGGIVGTGQLAKAGTVRAEIMTFTWLMMTVVGCAVLLWNESFVALWVGPEYYSGALANLLLIAMVMQFVLIRNDANIIDLSLSLRSKVLIGTASLVVSTGLATWFMRTFDSAIAGLCLGLMAGRLVLSIGYPILVGRFLGISTTGQLTALVRPGLSLALLFALARVLSERVTATTWWELMLSVAATVAITLPLAYYGGLCGLQRQRIQLRALSVVGRSGG